jgi:hypothetical protein
MRRKSIPQETPSERLLRDIRRTTRKVFRGREDPHRQRRPVWLGLHRRALPPGGHC